jgi:2-haloacid dehalogenase
MRKPQPEFYQLLLDRYNLEARTTLFIDDNLRNVTAAEQVGLQALYFSVPEELEKDLRRLNLF